ncbi:MAG: DUF6719 family protein [Pseudomonadota bacterium]
MPRLTSITAFTLLAVLAACGPNIVSEAPAPGTLPYNEVIFVDDGTCPAGQLSRHTGGSTNLNIARKVECVPRPQ